MGLYDFAEGPQLTERLPREKGSRQEELSGIKVHSPAMARIGIVDLGSNTARLVVFAYEAGRCFHLEDEIREPVRLAEGFGAGNRLSPAAVDRSVAALTLMADYAKATDLGHLEVIATSAVRDAENQSELLRRIEDLELDLWITAGTEEAELGVLAAANSLAMDDAWIVDLGGGSVQISLMEDRRFVSGKSFPLGMVRMSERFLVSDPAGRAEVLALEATAESHLSPTIQAMLDSDYPVVAMGGTVRNLARAVQKRASYPLELLHGYVLARTDLEALTARLLASSREERRNIPGIRQDRSDVITAGAVIYRWILQNCRRREIIISGHGMREGALYRHFLPAPHLLENVRDFSIRNLQAGFPQPLGHVDHVRFLAERLFDGLAPVFGLSPRDREILSAAARLHDLGTAVFYYRHHRHGAYLLGSGPLHGFSHREQVLIILLVRWHEKGFPRTAPYDPILSPGDSVLLQRLTACLRLAEHLERSRVGRVRDLEVAVEEERVAIQLHAIQEPVVEVWEALKLTGALFREAFGRPVEMSRAESPGREAKARLPSRGGELP